jgi:transposase
VLHAGIGWEDLPQELGFGPGMTCWRRLKRWNDPGVFDQLHQILLDRLNTANRIDWSRAAMDSNHIDAKEEGLGTGPSPVNRSKPGSKHHLIRDGNGTPISVLTSGANIPRHQPRPSSCSTATRLLPAVGAGHGGVSTCRWPSQARLAHDAQGLRSVHVVFSGQVATQLAAWRRVELGS